MNSGHIIKYRPKAQDKFYTPVALAKTLVPMVPFVRGDSLCDPFRGKGAFFNEFPAGYKQTWQEIDDGRDFFSVTKPSDWLISNPPYSCLDEVLEHSCTVAKKGFAYLLLGHALTPRRLEKIGELGFGLTKVHLCKVFLWYGISAFCVFEWGKPHIIEYDRVVWR